MCDQNSIQSSVPKQYDLTATSIKEPPRHPISEESDFAVKARQPIKSRSATNLASHDANSQFETKLVQNIIPFESEKNICKEILTPKFSQQLKKDGYLLPIGYEESAFPFPLPNEIIACKAKIDTSLNESFEDSSASTSSNYASKPHSYVNVNHDDPTVRNKKDLLWF